MNCQSHLLLDETCLAPAEEWRADASCWCFVRVHEGQGYWFGPEKTWEINQGDVLVLAPALEGHFRASSLGRVVLRHFRFCPDLLSGFLTLAELRHLERAATHRRRVLRRFPASHTVALQFAAAETVAAATNGLLRRSQVLQVAAAFFDRELGKRPAAVRTFLPASQRIRIMMQQLTEAEILGQAASELAARCNCSTRHFNRLFLENIGGSFRAKQTELRLLKARQLLAETDTKVAGVARAVGYRHPGLLNASFKKQFGVSPGEWRRRFRDGPAEAKPPMDSPS